MANPKQSDASNATPSPSQFDNMTQGISIGILLDSGKESISNYREEFHFQLNGEDETGAAYNGSQDYLIEVDKTADSQHEIETIQSPSRYLSGIHEYAKADGFFYIVRDEYQGGRICEKRELPADTSHYADFSVIRTILTITPGELLEKNMRVNGVLADVYEIKDISLLTVRELNKVSGKVWIAQEPAYFLKAEGEIEGVVEFENRYYKGNGTFTYEMKDFDQVEVQLPALCAYPPEEMIPLPPNATEIRNEPPRIHFSSPDSADQVQIYYLNELASQGWEILEVPPNEFEKVVQARITTQQDIEILLEIKIHSMVDYSKVNIHWQAQ
ncbi:MAG TPA: hypothetical protein G4N95_08900 [Anaerolineae bacterium]|nr:hypothetical protein [Anaerolineae bacterium]